MLNSDIIRKEIKGMKEIKNLEPVYLEQYDIHVNRYLTYAQIQQIVNAVIQFDTWAERQQNIDMLILFHATDMDSKKIEEIGIDTLLASGLVANVKNCIHNYYNIFEALNYTESIQRSLAQISRELPRYMDKVEDVIKNGGKK